MKMCILGDHNLDSLTKICSAKITHFRCKILRYQLTHPSDDKNLKIFKIFQKFETREKVIFHLIRIQMRLKKG